jgi:hypothetical protein
MGPLRTAAETHPPSSKSTIRRACKVVAPDIVTCGTVFPGGRKSSRRAFHLRMKELRFIKGTLKVLSWLE